jgi:magnesium-transporting ATPase (P-type)
MMTGLQSPIWTVPIEAVYTILNTASEGLSEQEAQSRFEKFGANELPEPAHRPLWLRFADQLTHFMALLLWVAGILAFISHTAALGWAIWAVIWINAIFSFSQEFQAERALAALKNVLPRQVKGLPAGYLATNSRTRVGARRRDAVGRGGSHFRRCASGLSRRTLY